jgi:uncharacterized protein (TIGR03435 family)
VNQSTGPFLLAACVAAIFAAPSAQAQPFAFEVASIKPSNTDGPMMGVLPGLRNGTLHGQRVTLRALLATAYGMMEPCVVGNDLLDKDHFDIVAKSPEGVPDSELKPMLQALLKERFNLAAHLEKREMNVYHLVVAKGGAKMSPIPAPGKAGPEIDPAYRGFPTIRATTMPRFVETIARIVSRPVIDKTGLTERYGILLSYAPLSPQSADHVQESGPPDLFKALQEQLGLRLQSARDFVEVVVIEHMERMPTQN